MSSASCCCILLIPVAWDPFPASPSPSVLVTAMELVPVLPLQMNNYLTVPAHKLDSPTMSRARIGSGRWDRAGAPLLLAPLWASPALWCSSTWTLRCPAPPKLSCPSCPLLLPCSHAAKPRALLCSSPGSA